MVPRVAPKVGFQTLPWEGRQGMVPRVAPPRWGSQGFDLPPCPVDLWFDLWFKVTFTILSVSFCLSYNPLLW